MWHLSALLVALLPLCAPLPAAHAAQYHPRFVNFTAPPGVLPAGIEWDGMHGCYLVTSEAAPALYRLFDSGHFAEFARVGGLPHGAQTEGIFVDYPRGRVLAVVTGGGASEGNADGAAAVHLLAYSLAAGKRQVHVPIPDDGAAAAARLPRGAGTCAATPLQVAVDATTGDAYVAGVGTTVLVWRVPQGADVAGAWLSGPLPPPAGGGTKPAAVGGCGDVVALGGLMYQREGHLLLASRDRGALFRVAVRVAAPETVQVAVNETLPDVRVLRERPDGRVVALSPATAWLLESSDSWQSAVIQDRVALGSSTSATDVALRNGLAYVLHAPRPDGAGVAARPFVAYTEFPSEEQKEPWLLLGICTGVLIIVLLLRFQVPYLIREQMKKRQ